MTLPSNRVYIPDLVGGGYGAFWRSRHRYRVVKGGKGSKKSCTAALWYIVHLMRYPGSNLLVVRRVMDTHRGSTFAQLKWAIDRLGVSHLWQCTLSPLEMIYRPTGQKIVFRGMDDVHKLASTTVSNGHLCWVWIEEAYEIEREEDFDKLDLSVPRGQVPEPLFKQTTLTFNPWSGAHWLKARFFDSQRADTLAITTNYLCNEFLDDTDRAVYEDMRVRHPRRYAVAGLGEWGVAEGLVYDNWRVEDFRVVAIGLDQDEDGHIVDNRWQWRHVFGLDYGYTNDPTAFIAAAVNPLTKTAYIYDEHSQTGMLCSDIANMLKRKGYAKERIRADAAEPRTNDELRRLGISRIQAADKGRDSILHGIAAIQEYTLIVHPSCVHTIAELGAYRWDTDKTGAALNRPVDRDNHLMDALRYAMLDVRYWRPTDPGAKRPRTDSERYIGRQVLDPSDLAGGWA